MRKGMPKSGASGPTSRIPGHSPRGMLGPDRIARAGRPPSADRGPAASLGVDPHHPSRPRPRRPVEGAGILEDSHADCQVPEGHSGLEPIPASECGPVAEPSCMALEHADRRPRSGGSEVGERWVKTGSREHSRRTTRPISPERHIYHSRTVLLFTHFHDVERTAPSITLCKRRLLPLILSQRVRLRVGMYRPGRLRRPGWHPEGASGMILIVGLGGSVRRGCRP